jgi:hypothetical protein
MAATIQSGTGDDLMAELAEQIEDRPREPRDVLGAALADALVREAIGLAALGLVLLLMDERFRVWARGITGRLKWNFRDAQRAAEDSAVARLRKDISDFEHQAAKGDGGCGCV